MNQLESEMKIARYKATEREADLLGRLISVRRLRPSEQAKLTGMTSDLTGFDEAEVVDEETGETKKLQIPHRVPFLVSAAVSEIDGVYIPFPRSRGELDAIYDRLDIEGITAAAKALARLTTSMGGPAVPLEEAKKSMTTESSS